MISLSNHQKISRCQVSESIINHQLFVTAWGVNEQNCFISVVTTLLLIKGAHRNSESVIRL
jgi:hypothetical protein